MVIIRALLSVTETTNQASKTVPAKKTVQRDVLVQTTHAKVRVFPENCSAVTVQFVTENLRLEAVCKIFVFRDDVWSDCNVDLDRIDKFDYDHNNDDYDHRTRSK